MKQFALVLLSALLMMGFEIPQVYSQGAPMPFRIGGTVTVDGTQMTQATDDGLVIKVLKPDGTNYTDVNGNTPEDKDGLNASNWYTVNIPIYKATIQPQGAKPGETAIIHVYRNSQEFQVTKPSNGQITIGEEGKVSQIDLTVATVIAETVSSPSTPTGPASGTTGASYTYSTGGSSSSKGHSVQYYFDWGDGTNSGWLAAGQTSASKSWSSSGTYTVKAQARCASDTSVTSGWSGTLSVSIFASTAETVSTPTTPSGPASGTTGASYTYSSGGSSSSKSHAVQYLFDWGDGTNSGWLAAGQSSASKSWSSSGTYTVKAQARCASDTSVISGWSGTLSVTITEITGGCKYFHEDFTGPIHSWTYPFGNWSIQGGKLNVDQIDSLAAAQSQFLPNDYFVIDVDVEAVLPSQDGTFWIYPFTTGDVFFSVDGKEIDGVAAILFLDGGSAHLLGWDVSAKQWYYSPKLTPSDPVTSIGLAYSRNAITLRINKKETSLKFSGNFANTTSIIDTLWLCAQGTGTRIRFDNVCADPLPNLPNLMLYQPSGWSDKIVVSKSAGSHTDSSPISATDKLFVDFAVINDSNLAISSRFYVALYVDDLLKQKWYWDSLNAQYYGYVEDYSIGSLGAGSHTITIVADSDEAIVERNESDNEYTKGIGPDLTGEWTPFTPSCKMTRSGLSCKITANLTVKNTGNQDAASTYVRIYLVDYLDATEGLFVKSISTGKIKAGKSKAIRVTYSLPVNTPASGKYIIALIDTDDLVEESNEDNNFVSYGPMP